jgi:hypothetical protein
MTPIELMDMAGNTVLWSGFVPTVPLPGDVLTVRQLPENEGEPQKLNFYQIQRRMFDMVLGYASSSTTVQLRGLEIDPRNGKAIEPLVNPASNIIQSRPH